MLSVIVACSIVVGGCAEDRKFDGDEVSTPASEHDGNSDLSASGWSTSEDGELSLRIVTAHGPISADEPVWVLAKVRNDSDETLTVLKPFGDQYMAEASGFEITGAEGKVEYSGDTPSDMLGADAFTYLVPGESMLDAWSTDCR
jgi:hypothetical protein